MEFAALTTAMMFAVKDRGSIIVKKSVDVKLGTVMTQRSSTESIPKVLVMLFQGISILKGAVG